MISRSGIIPNSLTQDEIGPIARTVTDAALLLDVMVGYDFADTITAFGSRHIPKTYTEPLNKDALLGAELVASKTSAAQKSLEDEIGIVDGMNSPTYKDRMLNRDKLRLAVVKKMADLNLDAILYPLQKTRDRTLIRIDSASAGYGRRTDETKRQVFEPHRVSSCHFPWRVLGFECFGPTRRARRGGAVGLGLCGAEAVGVCLRIRTGNALA